jgi:Ca2+-binding RTX toxin-like protein
MANVHGTNGNNWIDAADGVTDNADNIFGYEGDDTMFGLGGADLMKGGGGDDELNGGGGEDTLKGGGGADTLNGGSGLDTASYSESNAGVFVSLIGDTASGGHAEGDELNSIEGLTGSSYDDDLWGDNGANGLIGGAGEDTLKGYGGNDILNGDNGNDTLYGMDGEDILNGGDGTDYLSGGAGGDVLSGGAGNDTLIGGGGADWLYGFGGADTFRYQSLGDSRIVGGSAQDFIADFIAGQDKLDFRSLSVAAADVLIVNTTVNFDDFSTVGVDENGNGLFDEGEFAITVNVQEDAFVTLGDIILA